MNKDYLFDITVFLDLTFHVIRVLFKIVRFLFKLALSSCQGLILHAEVTQLIMELNYFLLCTPE